jgi:hypothetical protein
VVERAWPNDYQGKRYYFARINDQQLQTTDPAQGEELLTSIGKEIQAVVEASGKPNKFYLKTFILGSGESKPPQPTPKAEPNRSSTVRKTERLGLRHLRRDKTAVALHFGFRNHSEMGASVRRADAADFRHDLNVPLPDREPFFWTNALPERLGATLILSLCPKVGQCVSPKALWHCL